MQKSTAPLSTSGSRHLTLTKAGNCPDLSGYQKPEDPITATPQIPIPQGTELHVLPYGFLPSDPGQWNIEEVYDFISSLPGGSRLRSYGSAVLRRNVRMPLHL